jgi:hypothetical protein
VILWFNAIPLLKKSNLKLSDTSTKSENSFLDIDKKDDLSKNPAYHDLGCLPAAFSSEGNRLVTLFEI